MLKFTLKYLIFAPACFGLSGPSSGSFSQPQCKLPEDGPGEPKHVGANIRHCNVKFLSSVHCTADVIVPALHSVQLMQRSK